MDAKRKANELIHNLMMEILAKDSNTASAETESAIITLARGTFHFHIFAGTAEGGFKILTLKNHWATDNANIGNIVSKFL